MSSPRAGGGRKQKQTKKKKDTSVFQNFKLSGLDADTARYLPFESLSFPRLQQRPVGPEDGGPARRDPRDDDGGASNLHSMWMVGVLDYDEEQKRRELAASSDISKAVKVGSMVRRNVSHKKKKKLTSSKRNFNKMRRTYLAKVGSKKKTEKAGSKTMLRLFETEREQHGAAEMLQVCLFS